MAGFSTIRVDIAAGIATVTLNRPEVLNAYNLQMRDELWEVLANLSQDGQLRALIFRGSGRAFCAGADLTEFGTAPSPFVARRIRFERDVWAAIRTFPAPTIAAVHGHAIGTGFELALHCTFRVAARSTAVRMPEARLGLLPAAGGTQTLSRGTHPAIIGRLLYLGESMDADELAANGLVDLVVDDTGLDEAVGRLAGGLVDVPAVVSGTLLSILRALDERSVTDCVRYELRAGDQLLCHPRGLVTEGMDR